MNDQQSFYPIYTPSNETAGVVGQNSPSVTVVAVNATAVPSGAFPGTLDNNFCQVRVANKTSVWVHVNFGVLRSGQTVRAAALTDVAIAPGTVEVWTVDPEVNAASVFADGAPAGATSVIFTRGAGV